MAELLSLKGRGLRYGVSVWIPLGHAHRIVFGLYHGELLDYMPIESQSA